jgi:hypothetical protein
MLELLRCRKFRSSGEAVDAAMISSLDLGHAGTAQFNIILSESLVIIIKMRANTCSRQERATC